VKISTQMVLLICLTVAIGVVLTVALYIGVLQRPPVYHVPEKVVCVDSGQNCYKQ
jgi:hypothetical protein